MDTQKAIHCGKWALEVCFIDKNRGKIWQVIGYFESYSRAYEAMDKAFQNTQGLVLAVYRVVRAGF